jgi:hypothetical protein
MKQGTCTEKECGGDAGEIMTAERDDTQLDWDGAPIEQNSGRIVPERAPAKGGNGAIVGEGATPDDEDGDAEESAPARGDHVTVVGEGTPLEDEDEQTVPARLLVRLVMAAGGQPAETVVDQSLCCDVFDAGAPSHDMHHVSCISSGQQIYADNGWEYRCVDHVHSESQVSVLTAWSMFSYVPCLGYELFLVPLHIKLRPPYCRKTRCRRLVLQMIVFHRNVGLASPHPLVGVC